MSWWLDGCYLWPGLRTLHIAALLIPTVPVCTLSDLGTRPSLGWELISSNSLFLHLWRLSDVYGDRGEVLLTTGWGVYCRKTHFVYKYDLFLCLYQSYFRVCPRFQMYRGRQVRACKQTSLLHNLCLLLRHKWNPNPLVESTVIDLQ